MPIKAINGVNVHYEIYHPNQTETVVFLHGFTGSTKTWEEVIHFLPNNFRFIAVDLNGHGQTSSPADEILYTMDAQVDLLHALFTELDLTSFHLVGYSMGGRVAISYAVKYPEQIKTLLLESSTPGIVSEEERKLREEADVRLAEKMLQDGLEAFVDYWENIPLFASQKQLPEEKQQSIRSERLAHNTQGLANSLKMMGTGVMPSVWHKLHVLTMPVHLVTGELDEKFKCIANKMKDQMPHFAHTTVEQAGHAIHVEKPQKFATIVKVTIS